jgi:hypothetical protein
MSPSRSKLAASHPDAGGKHAKRLVVGPNHGRLRSSAGHPQLAFERQACHLGCRGVFCCSKRKVSGFRFS